MSTVLNGILGVVRVLHYGMRCGCGVQVETVTMFLAGLAFAGRTPVCSCLQFEHVVDLDLHVPLILHQVLVNHH